jgi:thioredoxin 1
MATETKPAASTLELTDQNFEETLGKGGILFIDFWAQWCGPCRAFAPVFEQAAKKHTDIIFAKVNTDEQQGLAQAFEIQAIPTLAVFRDGVLVGQNAGSLPGAALEDAISQVRGLDMNKIKEEIAARQAKKGQGEVGA